ncbi:MAG: Lipid II flippase FtsW [Firmicutes bacterium ADurb.Bin193]|nr:MAG: Lipid II flippase FtsW [Firmicutes bacterium ADurb.Bin193]
MKKGQIDFQFFITVMALLALGLIMVFSSSSESARHIFGNAYYFINRQLLWAVISVVAMMALSKFDYHRFGKLSFPILLISGFLLVLVLVVGEEINGGKRWINLGFSTFQPSEAAKISIILFFSYSLSKNPNILKTFWTGLLPYLAVLGIFSGFLMLEPHFSGTVVILGIGVVILFVGGAKILHLAMLGVPAVVGGWILIFTSEYRMKRITAFLDPFKDKLGDGWQIIQSLYAIGSGGIFGLGLGRSRQKFLYIPEPHNDFIFSILCEELGFIGALVTILLFAALIWRGIRIAMNAPDTFGSLLAVGITTLIAVEVIINIAVVTSSMPVTGMPLPFFSYGGTALFAIMCCMGIMLNISRQSVQK